MSFVYDDALPITAWRDEIAQAISDHQVLIVAGETGSGKTTQLPKICLELGRRSIGHTQPRRIAARTVAERIAEELTTELGDLVGYQVRFTRKASRATRLKVMTDGVLLAEIGHDRDLRRYDTIIIDEAHERSLNIDFLLGYLRQLTARRPDLKIIITSATIDTERFATHFATEDGTSAPIIEVSGRTYPVELRYRPLLRDGEADQIAGIIDAVKELGTVGDGDILVFLSGEREIRDAAEALNGLQLRNTSVLPLYARLSAADQHRVFASHTGRRIVLATNVAETSLTVPGIRYVVDAGTARISRYSARTKVQRLPIEPISQASANQRAGRCGRVAPGVCIRLYSEEDFAGRPEFTEPEILRTNLASVILQMSAADLGEIGSFPFVEAPDGSQITDGLRLLTELGALSDKGTRERPRLTAVGRRLAAIPVDPRMGRMLLAAEDQGCLREMLIIVSGLSIQDPRERPPEQRDKADALHRRFWSDAAASTRPEPTSTRPEPVEGQGSGASTSSARVEGQADGSDFLALLRLWNYLRDQQKALSGNAFRRMCRDEFLHFLRVREWQDLHAQLKQICRELGLHRNEAPAPPDRVHTAALAGLLSHVGLADLGPSTRSGRQPNVPARKQRRTPREYLGARGTRFAINPGSSLARTQPPLVMAAEIVETTRLWARTVGPITAEQVEEVGGHLLKRNYSEPHWSARAGSVMAYETVSLYGIPIVAGRPVGYGKINPAEARAIFLRSALVEGLWRTRHHFFADNQALRAEAEALEERARRRDLVVDDETILAFYDARVPGDITSVAHFDAWWKKARHQTPDLLTMTLADLTTGAADDDPDRVFPSTWTIGDSALPVDYVFDPASDRDGVIVQVPVSMLSQVDPGPFSWQVPGLRVELATELIRSLPKAVRRNLVPAPEYANRALGWLAQHPGDSSEPLPAALSRALRSLTGELIEPTAWDLAAVPRHLQITFDVVPDRDGGAALATGKDLGALQQAMAAQVSRALSAAASRLTKSGATRWDFGTIAERMELDRAGHRVTGYPALVDEGATVGLAVLDTPARQQQSQAAGLRRLVLLNTPDPTRWVVGHLSNTAKLALGHSPYASVPDLLADARLASVGELIRRHQTGPVLDATAFTALCDAVRADNPEFMRSVVSLDRRDPHRARRRAGRAAPGRRGQRTGGGRPRRTTRQSGLRRLPVGDLLRAPGRPAALPAGRRHPDLDAARATGTGPGRAGDHPGLRGGLRRAVRGGAAGPAARFVDDIGWLLEELRVSLFAQPLRTKVPVSEKRVLNAIAQARARLS